MSTDRPAWEYADGPEVGEEIPITNQPSQERTADVPESPRPSDEPRPDDAELEQRTVGVTDPSLDTHTTQMLTGELRDVLGTDRVTVPKDRPHPSRGEGAASANLGDYFTTRRLIVLMTFAMALTIGAIISLATGSWWLLPLAVGVHAVGTIAVLTRVIRLTTVSERPSPTLAAMLEEEGVRNADEHFSRLIEEFSPARHGDVSDVISPGANRRTATPAEDPSTAAAEQSTAMTPTAETSEPAGEQGTPARMIWSTMLALLAASVIIPAAFGGGAMWLLPVVMLPLLGAWIGIDRRLAARDQPGRQQTDG